MTFPEDRELSERREFLCSLGKWSSAAIAAILLIEASPSGEAAGWVNHRGSWVNGPGAGGWATRSVHGPTAADGLIVKVKDGSTAAGAAAVGLTGAVNKRRRL